MTDAPHLTFVIPIRHQLNARDWGVEKSNLARTAASIAAQTEPGWSAIVVCNHGADLPPLPEGFSVVHVDIPPNDGHEMMRTDRDAALHIFRKDKGARVVEGIKLAARQGSAYIMIVDGDDLVSNKLSAFVKAHQGGYGWQIDKGWAMDPDCKLAYRVERPFHKLCGTSLIVRRDLYDLPAPDTPEYWARLERVIGDHFYTVEEFEAEGTPLIPLPFEGATYIVGHANSHSLTTGLLSYALRKRYLARRPYALVKSLLRFRPVHRGLRRAFLGAA